MFTSYVACTVRLVEKRPILNHPHRVWITVNVVLSMFLNACRIIMGPKRKKPSAKPTDRGRVRGCSHAEGPLSIQNIRETYFLKESDIYKWQMENGTEGAGEFLSGNSPIKQPAATEAEQKGKKKKKPAKAAATQGPKPEDTDKYKDIQLFNYANWIATDRLQLPGQTEDPDTDVGQAKRGLIRLVDETKVAAVAKAFMEHSDVYNPNYPVSSQCCIRAN